MNKLLFFDIKLLAPKLTKKKSHLGVLKGEVFWLLAFIVKNIYLTKSGQNVDFWTFCDHDKGIKWSRHATEILKIKRIILIFLQKYEKSKKSLK